jgi:hypothetical protein
MNADLRYTPGEMKIPFGAAWRHHDRYMRALKLVGRYGKNCLDFGCGTCYGTELLRCFNDHCLAYDTDLPDCTVRAFEDDLGFPVSNDLFRVRRVAPYDSIYMIEVFEHLSRDEGAETLRFLKGCVESPDARLVLSTPIVAETTESPVNPHHKIEYAWDELRNQVLPSAGWRAVAADTFDVKWTDGTVGQQGILLCLPSANT